MDKKLSRKEREKLARHNEIMEAAIKVISEKGYANATLDEIAQRAELSKGTIYLYFKSKSDLFSSLIENGLQVMSEIRVKCSNTDKSIFEQIEDFIYQLLKFYKHHKQLFRVMFWEHNVMKSETTSEQRDCMMSNYNVIIENTIKWMSRGIESGEFNPNINPSKIALLIFSCVKNSILESIIMDYSINPKKETEEYCQLLFDGIRNKTK